jgi:23S rRNA (adenine2503-C2)-methyltransferase
MKNKPVLAGLSLGELKEELKLYPDLRSRQIFGWIRRGAINFDEMSDLPLNLRKTLEEKYALLAGEVSTELEDRDGTIKLGISLDDGVRIEAVVLRDGKDRKTACLSTQAGCPAGCVFCKTGRLGFTRNLTAFEIVGQYLHLKKRASDISHIVIMGMGEPLLNLGEVRKTFDFLTNVPGDGFGSSYVRGQNCGISKKRITLSTAGIVKGILDLAEKGPDLRLAFSLTTGRPDLRERLMPISRENPLPRIKEALRQYQEKRGRRITLEMTLIGGINTGLPDAKAAAEFAEGLNVVVNLIPWNPAGLEFEGRPLRQPERAETAAFKSALESFGLKVTHRTKKGQAISGACGQLGIGIDNTASALSRPFAEHGS